MEHYDLPVLNQAPNSWLTIISIVIIPKESVSSLLNEESELLEGQGHAQNSAVYIFIWQ